MSLVLNYSNFPFPAGTPLLLSKVSKPYDSDLLVLNMNATMGIALPQTEGRGKREERCVCVQR